MKSKSIRCMSGEHCIEFYIEFNPLKLARREVLTVDNRVVAVSDYALYRAQTILAADCVLSGVRRRITAISAPKSQGIKQGLQLRIDDEYISGDRDLVMTGTTGTSAGSPVYNEPLLAKAGSNGRPLVRFLRVYAIILVMFVALMIKHEGTEFFRHMSVDEFCFFLGVPVVVSALIFPALWMLRKLFR